MVIGRGPQREIIAQQLHNERRVFVARVIERIELFDGGVEALLREVARQLGLFQDFVVANTEIEREPEPRAVRTAQGVTSATGTFYAVTEYKGQTYGKVKKGAVKRKVTPPGKPDFAAYLSKTKTKPKPPSKN